MLKENGLDMLLFLRRYYSSVDRPALFDLEQEQFCPELLRRKLLFFE